MWTEYIGVLRNLTEGTVLESDHRPDRRTVPLSEIMDRLGEYYDRPFEVFESYYDTGMYRMPSEWEEKLGPSKQMDWGSWLYVCDRKTLMEFADERIRKIVHVIPAGQSGQETATREAPTDLNGLPDGELYGILEVELY